MTPHCIGDYFSCQPHDMFKGNDMYIRAKFRKVTVHHKPCPLNIADFSPS